ncbi:MAG: hypothetical protein E7L17_02900 [Clostridium sp.]|uniref:hypothetical protein n=1 Tax=Clostridium sp. TaxID=1506 RepID=UPI00290AD2F8|nr:hypothetical protein [Clostridium sp.]MDU7337044.1 hypothetical protein [Clostridium sp.]
MKDKMKNEAASPQKLEELRYLELENFYKQPDEEVKKEQAEDCPDCYYPQAEESEKKKLSKECAQCFYQTEETEADGKNR